MMLHRTNGGRTRGFTLLEMMVAVSILAVALTWLVEATMRAVEAENHAKLITSATFLARRVLIDLEDELQEKGLQDEAFSSEKEGTFEEEGFRRFAWRRIVDKITLPGQADVQSALSTAQNALGGSGGPGGSGGLLGGLLGGGGGSGSSGSGAPGAGGVGGASTNMFASQFGLVKDILEQGIRRVTVKVVWTEHGREQTVEVTEYLTDPRRVDQAIQMPLMGGAAPGQQPNQGSSSQGQMK